ncbi:MAG: hypothetical protein KBS68_06890 [Clostridiales bacterium]|nr:hypothetical protein [Candidatus Crickella merdequi]
MEFLRIRSRRKCIAGKFWGIVLMFALPYYLTDVGHEQTLFDIVTDGLILALPGLIILIISIRKSKKWDRLEACVNNVGNTYIRDIAAQLNKKEDWVVEELQKMVNMGFFKTRDGKNAYVDMTVGMLVITKNDEAMVSVADEIKRQKRAAARREELKNQSEAVKKIRAAIAVIDDKETVEVLRNLEDSIKRVENTLVEKPELEEDKMVVKMRTDYVPTALSLIEKLKSDMFTDETKAKITSTLVTCTEAFYNLDEGLNENDNLMTQVDLDVIKTKLASEGFLDSDFNL